MHEASDNRPGHLAQTEPSAWLARFAPLVRAGGPVLDLACGGGRNARLFLDRGHPVTAVDRDTAWIAEALGERAGLEIVTADLEDGRPWPFDGRRFAGVAVTNYLHRPLFPKLLAALDETGVLIYETFAAGQEAFSRPRNPDHLLMSGELLEVARGQLHVVAFEQGLVERSGKTSVVQRLCAARTYGPWKI
ncbi:MAG: class I SAM-dependent methyltransferase [Rhodospirillales bacterium]|nr:class I SAM-dependent methyltransferase [Rhodospirillales bacterium]